jgi:uncharacterized protein involved in exopolysaccharide biosynthesis
MRMSWYMVIVTGFITGLALGALAILFNSWINRRLI